MAYSEQIVTAVTDIPALVAAFAHAHGWSGAGNTVTPPGGGKNFTISAVINGTNNRQHDVFITDTAVPTQRTWCRMPWTGGTTANPVVLTPTKLHLFANDDPWEPAPYVGIVIECGYNAYRHMYIGKMAAFGNYTGREIICSNQWANPAAGNPAGTTKSFDNTENKYLFSARHNAMGGSGPVALDSGGVNVVHADNANAWRRFDAGAGVDARFAFAGNEVFGGAADSINSGLLRRGTSDFAGSNILVPINLYAPDSANFGNDVRFRPLGFVPGIRMIDMRGLDPGQAFAVGNDDWRVFPEFSKRSATSAAYGTSRADGGAGGYYPIYETSYMLGLAYPEGG